MCRHLAYVGPPVRLGTLLLDPPHALVRQAWAPRRQTRGVVNADGFGLGWYVDGIAEPARHRGAGPVWADETFGELCRVVVAGGVLAAVRSATAGMPAGVAASAPFRSGRWLFSLNGALLGWPASGAALAEAAGLSGARLVGLETGSDAALLWALVADRLAAGEAPGEALRRVVGQARAVVPDGAEPHLNLLLTDGRTVLGTACGASLAWRSGPGVVLASEPYDDHPSWHDVPDGHLVEASTDGVQLHPL
jgi:glutamine amidotransferase